MQELDGVGDCLGDDLCSSPCADSGAAHDQRRPDACVVDSPCHDRGVSLSAWIERPLLVRKAGLAPAGFRVAENGEGFHSGPILRCGGAQVYIMPVCSLASSDIMLWFQGGSNTNSTATSATVGMMAIFSLASCTRMSPMPQPGAVNVMSTLTDRWPSGVLVTSQRYTNPRSTMLIGISGS